MISVQSRFLIVLSFAAMVAIATIVLYLKLQKNFLFTSKSQPIAKMSEIVNDTLKKQPGHLVWEQLSKDDYIYSGESIRTMVNSSAHVEFLKDGSVIKIDPESVIVLDMQSDRILLDFLKGSLFIENKGKDTNNLLIKSDGKTQILNSKEFSMSKDDKNGLIIENKIKLQTPKNFSDDILTETEQENVEYALNSDAELTNLEFWSGPVRTEMKRQKVFSKIPKGVFKFNFLSPVGNNYWQVKGDSKSGSIASPIQSFKIQKYTEPVITFPKEDSQFIKSSDSNPIDFRWVNKIKNLKHKVQLSLDAKFSEIKTESSLKLDSEAQIIIKDEGNYYWRLISVNKNKTFTSEIHKFSYFSIEKAKTLLADQKTSEQIKLEFLNPKLNIIEVQDLPFSVNFKWSEPKSSHVSYSLTAKSQLPSDASTSTQNSSSKTYSLNLNQTLTANSMNIKFPDVGNYEIEIYAKSPEGILLGSAGPFQLSLVYPSLLPAPLINSLPTNSEIKADLKGDFRLHWKQIARAKHYIIGLYKNAKLIKNYTAKKDNLNLHALKPGTYKIKALTLDQFNRESEKQTEYTLIVPNQSDALAPELKKIKVR